MLQSSSQDIKLKIIEQLVSESDIKLLQDVEKLIQESHYQSTIKRFTQDEIIQRALIANSDIQNNRLYTQKEAENLSKMW